MQPALAKLEVKNLTCVRGVRVLFRDVHFSIAAGRALVVEGANGAGKTSLLRILGGFLAPAAGEILLSTSNTVLTDAEERGQHVGWLGHQDGLKPQLTAKENLSFAAQLYGRRADVAPLLDWAGIARAADFPTHYLSAGQKKRLALARLKASGRALWLLDEPFAALDVAGKHLVEQMLAEHCASGGIAIIATHEALALNAEKLTVGAAP